jgi:hypothetical protein
MMPSGTLAIGVSLKTELNYAPGAVLDTSDVDISAGLKTSDVLVLQYTVGGLIPEVGPAGVRGVMALRNVRVLGELVPECEGMAQCPAAGIFNPNVLRGSVSFRPTSAMASWWRNAMPLSLFRLTTMAPVLSFEVSSADSSAPVMPWSGTEGVPLSDKFFVSVIDDAGSGSGDDGSGGENPPPPPQPAPYFTLSRSAGTQSNVYGQPVEFFLKVGNFLTPPEILCDLPAGLTLSDDKTLISGVILDSFLVRCVARLGETLAASSEILSVAVEPKPVEASIYVRDKTYDGATTVLQSHCLISAEDIVRPEDDVTCGLSSASFPGSQEGLYSLSASDMSIASFGAHARLYDVRFTGSVEALILARRLEVFWYAMDKQYDGTRLASYGYTLDGLLSGDEANVSASSVLFSDASPGPDKRIDIYGVAVDNRNYFVSPEATATASIAKRKLTAARPGNVAVAQYSWDDVVFVPYFEGFVEGESPLPLNIAEIRYVVTPLSSVTCEAPFSDGGFCQVSFDPATLPYFENYDLPDSGPAGGYLYISDVTPPFVLSVSATPDGVSLKAGAQVLVGVTFSENVDVVGAPTLRIATAPGVSRTLNYDAGLSTPDTLIFPYTVQAGDNIDPMDADELVTVFGESFIADRAGLPADIGLSSYQGLTLASSGVILDTTAPSITYLSISPASPGNSQTPEITINLSEAASSIQLFSDGSCGSSASTDSTGATGAKIITTSSLTADATTALYAKATDIAGNVSSCSPMTSYTHDGAAPTVTSVTSPIADGTYGLGQLIPVTVAFSETVYVTGTPQLTLATGGAGTAVNYTSGSGTNTLTFNYTVVEGHGSSDLDYTFFVFALALNGGTIVDGSNNGATLSLPIPGSAGSLGANKAIVIDTTPPAEPQILGGSRDFMPDQQTGVMRVEITSSDMTANDFDGFYYTTDGSVPSCGTSAKTSSGVDIAAYGTTLKVRACDLAGNMSTVAEAFYSLYVPLAKITDQTLETFPDTSAYPAVSWVPKISLSVDLDSRVSLFAASSGGYAFHVFNPASASSRNNMTREALQSMLADPVAVYAEVGAAPRAQLGSYKTNYPASFYFAGTNGNINAVARDTVSSGCADVYPCFVVGGSFTAAGGTAASLIALYKTSDGTWSQVGGGITGSSVDALLMVGSDLYVGGSFSKAGTVSASNIAKWDGSSWSALGSGTTGTVKSLANINLSILVGGQFSSAGGRSGSSRIAVWSDGIWSTLGTGITGSGTSSVNAIAYIEPYIYAGGNFTSAGGVAANNIAYWDGSTWQAMGAGANSTLYSFAANGTDLYVGGAFTTIAGVTVNRVAKWTGSSSSWSALGSGIGSGNVQSVVADGGSVYAGGTFPSAGGVTASNVARWNGSAWSSMGGTVTGSVSRLAAAGSGSVYLFGQMTTVGGLPASYAAKWNGSSLAPLAESRAVMGALTATAVDNKSPGCSEREPCLYVAGYFKTIGNITTNNIARYKTSDGTWSALGTGIGDGMVNSLSVSDSGDLYAGGSFSTMGGVAAGRVAKWNGSAWSALGTGVNSVVYVVHAAGGNVYAGGDFTSAGGLSASRVAKWTGSDWQALGTGVNSSVYALAADASGQVWAGGDFTSAGGSAASRIARWDGSSWQAAGTGMSASVRALVIAGGELYAGGAFTSAGGLSANRVAKWNGSAWSALGTGVNSVVYGLASSGSKIYAAGTFTGGFSANRIASWDGSAWTSLGGGLNGDAVSVSTSGGNLYAGGYFDTAGGKLRPYLARWVEAFEDWH